MENNEDSIGALIFVIIAISIMYHLLDTDGILFCIALGIWMD